MLTTEEKAKIRSEERYRMEIQQEIKSRQKKTKASKLLEFFNSNLGLFILSTIFIGFFSWAYNAVQLGYKEKIEEKKKIECLSLEIANRVKLMSKIGEGYPGQERVILSTAILGLNNTNAASVDIHPAYSPIFPEYRDRSLLSTIVELGNIKKIDKSQLKLTTDFVDKLPDYYWSAVPVNDKYWVLPDSTKREYLKRYKLFTISVSKIISSQD